MISKRIHVSIVVSELPHVHWWDEVVNPKLVLGFNLILPEFFRGDLVLAPRAGGKLCFFNLLRFYLFSLLPLQSADILGYPIKLSGSLRVDNVQELFASLFSRVFLQVDSEFFDQASISILDHVLSPSHRDLLGDIGPSSSSFHNGSNDLDILFFDPLPFVDVGVRMIFPSVSATSPAFEEPLARLFEELVADDLPLVIFGLFGKNPFKNLSFFLIPNWAVARLLIEGKDVLIPEKGFLFEGKQSSDYLELFLGLNEIIFTMSLMLICFASAK